MGKQYREPTVRKNIFDDETSEVGKARVAKFHRDLQEVVDRCLQSRPAPPSRSRREEPPA